MSWSGWPWNGPNLAPEQISQLPIAGTVSLADQLPADQANGNGTYTTRAVTIQQILSLLSPPSGYVSITQVKQALAVQNQMFIVSAAVPGSIADPTNIRWSTGGYSILGDAFSVFVQTATGYTNNQMITLYALAATQPA